MAATSPVSLAEELLKTVKSLEGQGSRLSPQQAYDATRRVETLTDKIKRTVLGPLEYTIQIAESCHESAALRFVTELGVADAIGDDVKTLSEISQQAGVGTLYLGIAMSCLVAHGYFEEVDGFGSRVYKNNAMSNILRAHSDDTFCSAIGFVCDDSFKAAAHLVETARAGGNKGGKKGKSGANLAFGFEGPLFEWYSGPAQVWRGQRMGRAMQQLHKMANGNVVTDFDWCALDGPVVDVGGGIGSLEMTVMKTFPDTAPPFIIFDIAETSADARKAWSAQPPAAQARVSFAAGDFLASTLEGTGLPRGQPTYLIRHVLHDWTDDEAVGILSNVRIAMLASNEGARKAHGRPKLLLCEMLLQERSGRFVYTTSVQALALNNGKTRTEAEMVGLLERAGFKVVKVHAMRAVDSIIEATPAEL
ncbi:uncharacterized protein PHACADRAFT_259202 [Phanerochaete carnosa HHB-10118-sp]|uniref:Uncharacterized protein n=1 Tax=Phanerochaete carnosa (strain HHB-10118-sp) TaxID=650164 RepID=K5VNI5_PHACS|nr:uncharacterized protein PHACADRAFT_259202 [Phanerochaete carnosa HHB-10118-sp]EKM53028.1 hypothetical protein PHACADRAFT_259202 [Phanerochaete carnosa HHB-10118-sp]